jgi:hypothetical protein
MREQELGVIFAPETNVITSYFPDSVCHYCFVFIAIVIFWCWLFLFVT